MFGTLLLRLGLITTVLLGSLDPTIVRAEPDKPNVVFILIDDLGAHDLGCYGSRFYRTPQLDRLASQGMKFTDAYAACPVCSPTRASILTGKYPARLHLTDWLPGRADRPDQKLLRPVIRQQLPLEEVSLASVLKSAGYATAMIGKWHLGGPGFEPQRFGFDVNIGGDQLGSPRNYFAPFRDRNGHYMPGLEKAEPGEYLTDRLTDEAEKFITANRERPFFLYLAHYAVHIPLKAKEELTAKYKDKPQRPGEQNNPLYAAMIESVDEGVGSILRRLMELGLDRRTLVIFTSDNGGLSVLEGPDTPSTINTPLREGKGYLYEGGIREPLLIRWPPGVRAGSVCTTPVCSIDFLPTIVEICGVNSPVKVDGHSLLPLLRETGDWQRDALYWHYPHYSNQGGRPGAAVRAGDFKLIEFYEQGRLELYNLKKDVGESQNLVERESARVTELHTKLAAWRREMGAQMMTPNPSYRSNPQAADGTIYLPANTADVHGVQLRYEPLPHKNTLGFWVRTEDWASWDFRIVRPGRFTVEILQGCGAGQGGSEVELSVGDQKLQFTVEDTGHFQNFKKLQIGIVILPHTGAYTLSVKPKSKPGVAVMDLRSVILLAVDEIFGPETKLKVEAGKGAAGEGPAWHPRLGVLTSGNGHIYQFDRSGKSRIFRNDAGTNGLLFDAQGRLLACEPVQRRITRTEPDGTITILTAQFEGKRYNEPNDLTVDAQGRIYFSDPRYGPRAGKDILDDQGRIIEGVYRIDSDGKVTRIIGRELERPNGVLVSADDRYLYVADNNNNAVGGARKLWRFDLRRDGSVDLASKKLLFDWQQGRGPDGLKQDQKGRLYVAAGLTKPNPPLEPDQDRKGGIYVLSPEGKLLAFLSVPTDEVTNCAFGGDDLKTLYISAGGTLYSIRTTTPGRVVWPPAR